MQPAQIAQNLPIFLASSCQLVALSSYELPLAIDFHRQPPGISLIADAHEYLHALGQKLGLFLFPVYAIRQIQNSTA